MNIKFNSQDIVNYLLHDYKSEDIVNDNVKKRIKNVFKLDNLLGMEIVKTSSVKKISNKSVTNNPIVYIYNTHQTEEYAKTTLAEYSVSPNISITDYIMQDIFNKNGINTIVEEGSITEVRKLNNWNYEGCYKASRVLMEEAKRKNNSLKYFIDLHRDSLPHDKTTITIGDETYAKIIFLIGLENKRYEENLKFTEYINSKVNEKYPGLSKGIYKKGGPGVNGVYNQDFSPYTILIEIGGNENNTTEVMNTTLAVSEILKEVILEYEQKEYN
ncbi:MAG: stage II sporulation protein P [Bacilli bacterium]|nr:stage II sporulation protein P [Bacilli bacterium]